MIVYTCSGAGGARRQRADRCCLHHYYVKPKLASMSDLMLVHDGVPHAKHHKLWQVWWRLAAHRSAASWGRAGPLAPLSPFGVKS
jgi:hypothetical protein